MKTRIFNWILIAIILLSLCVVMLYYRPRSSKPEPRNLSEFLIKHPSPGLKWEYRRDGRAYLLIYKDTDVADVLILSEARTAYLFDDKGQLVDYTPDITNDERFRSKWPGVSRDRSLLTDNQLMNWPGAK
jgi:hypothetical protein